MKKIVPAILTDDPKALVQMISSAEKFCDLVQIDIMDGKFVPSKSINSDDLKKIKTNLYLEVHLMVLNPENYFKGFKEAGAKRIIFHYEAAPRPKELIDTLKKLKIKPGIAINPETPVTAIDPFLDELDMVLLLAVNPGFYGSPFIPEVLQKARELSQMRKKIILALDGGVKFDNVREIADSGVEQIDVGSAIFKNGDPRANYKKFAELVK